MNEVPLRRPEEIEETPYQKPQAKTLRRCCRLLFWCKRKKRQKSHTQSKRIENPRVMGWSGFCLEISLPMSNKLKSNVNNISCLRYRVKERKSFKIRVIRVIRDNPRFAAYSPRFMP